MRRVQINLKPRGYEIRIGAGLLDGKENFLPCIQGEQVFIISNQVVAPLYLSRLKTALAGKQIHECILPDGEKTKTLSVAETVFDRLLAAKCDRNVTIIALGGGVTGDLAGFVAACYQRGVGFLQIPTTLLAQVDSSVGGKTAVNLARGKNMIGAFYQPLGVVADTDALATLPAREFSAGLAEIIKYGAICDADFFVWLEQNMDALLARDAGALAHAIEQSCINKSRIVERDEKEAGERALLNFGHTFGHAIETATHYAQLHGEAVAIGMAMAAHLSRLQGDLGGAEVTRLTDLLTRAQLPIALSGVDADAMQQLMRVDKKVRDGKLHLILLDKIGCARVRADYDARHLQTTLAAFCAT